MSPSEFEWWENFAKEEEEGVKLWSSYSHEDYHVAGRTFNLFEIKYSEPDQEKEEVGEEYWKRERELERLIEKKNNHVHVKKLTLKCHKRTPAALVRKGTFKNH
ncbi:hypothetical protein ACROYT_G015992 [Oculina patagonica]